jgi:hypothetical protein
VHVAAKATPTSPDPVVGQLIVNCGLIVPLKVWVVAETLSVTCAV